MTFYLDDDANGLPNLPSLSFVLDESPACLQSINYWEKQTEEIGCVVSYVTSRAKEYHKAGVEFSHASANFSTCLQKAANVLAKEKNFSEPLVKFADMLQRVDCYYDMFLSQTEMLMCTPLDKIAQEFEKVKEMKNQLKKANHDMHVSWEKFSSCQNVNNLQEPSVLDKLAHNMLHSRQHYQQLLSNYINLLREVNTAKKVTFVKTLVEHILAKFFFVNFTYQILKDSENYINELFDDLLNRVLHTQISCENDARLRGVVGLKINRLTEKDRTAFNEPPTILGSSSLAHSVTTVNTQAGKLFNRINDFLGSSGIRDSIRKSQKGGQRSPSPDTPNIEQWEVVEEETKTSKSQDDDDNSKEIREDGQIENEKVEDATVMKSINEGSEATGSEAAGSEAAGSEAAGSEAAGSEATGSEAAGSEAAGSEAAGSEAAEVKTTQVKTTEVDKVDSDSKPNKDENPEDGTWGGFKSADDIKEDNANLGGTKEDEDIIMETDDLEIPDVSQWVNCHRGYLRIKQKGFPKPKWPLLYFIVDQSNGRLLAQGKEQHEPIEFANLLLSSVKTYKGIDIDRNFCFQLTSPNKSEQILQAINMNEMNQWMSAIQAATTEALKKSKEKLLSLTTSYNYGSNVKTEEPKQYVANAPERVRKIDGNTRCVDCNHPRPDWTSINIGVVMCIECSGVHRSLGVHISKVRSLTLDKWTENVVQFMEDHGNTKVNKKYEGNLGSHQKPTRDSKKEERSEFIRLKYADKKFVCEDTDDNLELTSLQENEEQLLNEEDLSTTDGQIMDSQKFASSQLQVKD